MHLSDTHIVRADRSDDERKIFDWHAAKRAAFAEEELKGLRAEAAK